jgi:hypothetical protein
MTITKPYWHQRIGPGNDSEQTGGLCRDKTGLARRMVKKEIPGVCFVPLPLVHDFFKALPDVPEQLKIFSIFPKPVRMWLFCRIPDFIRDRVPILRQDIDRLKKFTMSSIFE